MKVRVTYDSPQMNLDEVFSGGTAEEVVGAMKAEAAGRAGFAVRLLVSAMSPLRFAQEVVSRYNEATGSSVPAPRSCDEFLTQGEGLGIVTFLER